MDSVLPYGYRNPGTCAAITWSTDTFGLEPVRVKLLATHRVTRYLFTVTRTVAVVLPNYGKTDTSSKLVFNLQCKIAGQLK